MSTYRMLEECGFRPSVEQRAAIEAAALEEMKARNLHVLRSPTGAHVVCCGRRYWNPDGDTSLVRDIVEAGTHEWVPVGHETLARMAKQRVIGDINAYWRMVNSDSVSEALGG